MTLTATSQPSLSPTRLVLRRFLRHRLAVIALTMVGLILLVTAAAPSLAPFRPGRLAVAEAFRPPWAVEPKTQQRYVLGTDNLGRDYFSRLLYGGRISLTIAIITTTLSILIGLAVGAVSGYRGGWLDAVLMRAVEFLATIPVLPLLLIISALLLRSEEAVAIPGPVLDTVSALTLLNERDARQAVLIILVLTALGWLNDARLMRSSVLALRDQTFIESARSLGASDVSIVLRHMLPNAIAPIIVNASLNLSGFVVAEAALSFLGFGLQDPIPTWGNMLAATQQFMAARPWLPLIPGLPIVLCSLAFNYVGDGLRDALDPRR
jgi:peptide/nickel transport system permease protein